MKGRLRTICEKLFSCCKRLISRTSRKPAPPTSRVFRIEGEIDDKMANECIAHLLFWQMADPTASVSLEINSLGGSVTATFAILDTMAFVGYPIHTRCRARAFGCAALILARGTRGCRTAGEMSTIGLTRTIPRDSTANPQIMLRFVCKLDARIHDELCTATGRAKEEIANDKELERIFSASEALEYGLIDRICSARPPQTTTGREPSSH